MPCNVFVYCPLEECWEPDAWHATKGDCWRRGAHAAGAAVQQVMTEGCLLEGVHAAGAAVQQVITEECLLEGVHAERSAC
eukprot:1158735-Pelagomonas_calceolata.AAC.7